MIYHVLPGDAQVETFKETNIEGEMVVCRECLIEGDLKAESLQDFWRVRENYLSKAYPDSEISYAENVKSEFEKLLNISPDDEVNLWFEYELFCQSNLWFCLSLLSETDAQIYRVAPVVRNENDLWKGFGKLSASDLKKCFGQRIRLSKEDVQFGKELWEHFQLKSFDFIDFEKADNFPHLKEVCEAAAEIESRPEARMREILETSETDFGKVFEKFRETEGVYGFGDTQVRKIFDSFSSKDDF
jgi:hypothetical protein